MYSNVDVNGLSACVDGKKERRIYKVVLTGGLSLFKFVWLGPVLWSNKWSIDRFTAQPCLAVI